MIVHVVIVKGNPKFINTPLAKKYYSEIKEFLLELGVKRVTFDAGLEKTCPRAADFYVTHSKGASRIKHCTSMNEDNSLKFGTKDGISHEVDLTYMATKVMGVDPPPWEHFIFIQEQKDAITEMYNKLQGIPNEKDNI